MRKIPLYVTVVSMLLITACSSPETKENGAERTRNETSSTTSTTSTTVIDPDLDLQRSEAIVLTTEDLPGWSATPVDQAERAAEVVDMATRAASCRPAGISDESWNGAGKEIFGPTLTKDVTTIESSVTFLPSKETGLADISALRDEAARQCYADVQKQQLIEEITAASGGMANADQVEITMTVRPLVLEGFGANTVAERAVITANYEGIELGHFTNDVIMTVQDRTMISLGYSVEDGEPDVDFEREIIQKIRTKAIKAIRSQAV